jgi:hypothetical protein
MITAMHSAAPDKLRRALQLELEGGRAPSAFDELAHRVDEQAAAKSPS